jgi:hypothetical protein
MIWKSYEFWNYYLEKKHYESYIYIEIEAAMQIINRYDDNK